MRQTPLLEAVLKVLEKQARPLSVPDILAALKKQNLQPNKTTLYRMLDKLTQEHTLEALLLDPKITYYELKTHHHHHFLCEDCEVIRCIADPQLEKQIHELEHQLKAAGLKVQEHHFSMTGKCEACV